MMALPLSSGLLRLTLRASRPTRTIRLHRALWRLLSPGLPAVPLPLLLTLLARTTQPFPQLGRRPPSRTRTKRHANVRSVTDGSQWPTSLGCRDDRRPRRAMHAVYEIQSSLPRRSLLIAF